VRADRIEKILNHSDVIFVDRTDLAFKAGFPPRMAALNQKVAIAGDCALTLP
jgi:pyruvate kinase